MGLWIKVCCIADEAEAAQAVEAGADALGLVSAMPSGPGVIADAAIARIARAVAPPTRSFLLTSRTDAAGIVAQQRSAGCTTLQLVDRVAPQQYPRLRAELPGVELVQVVHVTGAEAVAEAAAAAGMADALRLDSGDPTGRVKRLGGTGRVHDWGLSRAVVEASGASGSPVWLAGGLRPGNVAGAVRAVQPAGVDVCSGVRTAGRLDPEKLRAFIGEARGAAG